MFSTQNIAFRCALLLQDEQCLIKLGIINEVEEGEIDKRVALKVDVPGWRAMGEKKDNKRKVRIRYRTSSRVFNK